MNEMKGDKSKSMRNKIKYKQKISLKNLRKSSKGITLIALVITRLDFFLYTRNFLKPLAKSKKHDIIFSNVIEKTKTRTR